MINYILRRLVLIIPTLWAIITINFFIVQAAPGGPIDKMIGNMRGIKDSSLSNITGENNSETATNTEKSDSSMTRGSRGLDKEVIEEIKRRYGFDKPLYVRYLDLLWKYARFDFGESLFRGRKVVELITERIPVSVSIGLWSTLIIYFISIPLGIKKAIRHGSRFDIWSSTVVILGNAIPGFLFAVLLVVIFAGGSFLHIFPLRGLVSVNFNDLTWYQKILDYFWHMALPITASVIGGFATLTMLTKNCFLDEINKQYVLTARSKGLKENKILYGHVFQNAMLLIIAGFPSAFISIFFTGSLLIEVIFSLEGLGLLGFESTMQRDYPVMFGTLYMFTLLGLILNIISDLTYTLIDPRIDFERR